MKRGMNRTVLLTGKLALKFPSWRNGWIAFLFGLLANNLEHERWTKSHHANLARVYCCLLGGLCLVMQRYKEVPRRLTREELDQLPFINIDNNGANVGVNGSDFVLLDYGNTDWYLYIKEIEL